MNDRFTQSKSKVQSDFQTLLGDVQELLDATKEGLNKEGTKVRERLTERMAELKGRYDSMQDDFMQRAQQAEASLESTLKRRPLETLGGVDLVGAFLGWLAGRK